MDKNMVRVIEDKIHLMYEGIQGKLILVRVSMRFKLATVRVIWSQLYYVIFLNCTSHLLFIYSHGTISSAIYYNGMFDLITLQIQELFIGAGGRTQT